MDPLVAFSSEADDELKNIRLQMRALQTRTSKKVDMLRDLQLFFCRQAEIEQAYGRQLESLHSKFIKPRSERSTVSNVAKALTSRKPNDEEVDPTAAEEDLSGLLDDVWTSILSQLKKRATARIRFASKLGEEMKSRFDSLEKETTSTSKKCLDLGHSLHGDLQSSFKHAEETMRSYHNYHGKYLKAVEQHSKALEKGQLKKGGKMKEKVTAAEKKATAARNDYILAREAANSRKNRFYDVEVGRIVDVMNLFFHSSVRYTFKILHDMFKQNQAIEQRCFESISSSAQAVSVAVDREHFMRENAVYFGSRPAFEHIRSRGDEIESIMCNPDTLGDLMQRYTDTGALASKSVLQLKKERQTLMTITSLRLEKIGHTLQTNEHGIYRSVENSEMLSDCYSRLVHNCIHFQSLNSQIVLLGNALGPNKPQTTHDFAKEKQISDEEDVNMFQELLDASSKEVTSSELLQTNSLRRNSSANSISGNSALHALATPNTINGIMRDDLSPIRSRSDSMASTTSLGDGDDQDAQNRRPAPAPPQQSQSPRLGRAKKRTKRPERPPEPKKSSKGSPKKDHQAKLRSATISSQNPYRFGGVLQEIAEVTKSKVPMIVISCIKSLHECGVDVEGIFRIPGSQAQVDEIQRGFETGRDPFFSGTPDHVQPFAVAGVLKLYIRSLGDSVMTFEHYPKFVQVAMLPDHNSRLHRLRDCIHAYLPQANIDLLRILLPFLMEVAQIKENKMDIPNLAVVFGPTLMPAPKDDATAMVRDAAAINAVVSLMIEFHTWLLKDESEYDNVRDEDGLVQDSGEDDDDDDDEGLEEDTSSLPITTATKIPTSSTPNPQEFQNQIEVEESGLLRRASKYNTVRLPSSRMRDQLDTRENATINSQMKALRKLQKKKAEANRHTKKHQYGELSIFRKKLADAMEEMQKQHDTEETLLSKELQASCDKLERTQALERKKYEEELQKLCDRKKKEQKANLAVKLHELKKDHKKALRESEDKKSLKREFAEKSSELDAKRKSDYKTKSLVYVNSNMKILRARQRIVAAKLHIEQMEEELSLKRKHLNDRMEMSTIHNTESLHALMRQHLQNLQAVEVEYSQERQKLELIHLQENHARSQTTVRREHVSQSRKYDKQLKNLTVTNEQVQEVYRRQTAKHDELQAAKERHRKGMADKKQVKRLEKMEKQALIEARLSVVKTETIKLNEKQLREFNTLKRRQDEEKNELISFFHARTEHMQKTHQYEVGSLEDTLSSEMEAAAKLKKVELDNFDKGKNATMTREEEKFDGVLKENETIISEEMARLKGLGDGWQLN
eukprot:m.93653 g.93653  ORF g.93653 m.93653 type:complete len:1305 (-) comp8917_c3_seq4:906-4820(-)